MQPDHAHSAIPLFDRTLHHSSVPTEAGAAAARRGGPGRPPGRRLGALPWTVASTVARWHRVGWMLGLMMAIVMAGVCAPMSGDAQTMPPASRAIAVAQADPFASFIAEASHRFAVPALWVRFVMQAESGGNPDAVSPKGAMGLMQIMPDTYARLRESYGLGADPFQPRDNILAGAAYLREMYDEFGSPGFLAAYNAGPARYENHLTTGRPLPEETRLYLARLAPMIAGVQAERIAMAPDPLAWTRAPLFVGSATNVAANAHAGQSDRNAEVIGSQPRRRALLPSTDDVAALIPRSNGLFIGAATGDGLP